MKKTMYPSKWNRGAKSALALVLLLLILPVSALADRSLSMEEVVMEAQLLPDASMRVVERITVDFSGAWNGFYVKIPQGQSLIKEISVSENGKAYQYQSGTDYGPPGTYLTKTEGDNILIDWSISATDEVRTFELSYRVINAVSLHTDTAELYRKFIGEYNGNEIDRVEVNLALPAGAEGLSQGDELKIWGHGPLNGEVAFTEGNQVSWLVKNLPPYTFLEGRVLMPTTLFPHAPKEAYTGTVALSRILAEEEGWAKKANTERLEARVSYLGAAGILGFSLFGIVLLWRKYGRRHTTDFTGDYYRELPDTYSPAELSVLWNYNKMKASDITATILDLARRNFLYLKEERVETRKLIGTKTTTTYLLEFLPVPEPRTLRRPEEATLLPHEQELISFLQTQIGGGKESIYLTDIEQYAKKYGESFFEFWQGWTASVMENSADHEFFDHSGKMPTFAILGGLGLLFLGSALLAKTGAGAVGFALVIAGGLFLFIPRQFKRRSKKGEEDYVRWKAFQKFLLHFSEMQRYEIPSLVIWEHYLVFAVTLGVAKEVIKQLELIFPNLEDGDYRFGSSWMASGAYHNLNSLQHSFDGIGNTFERAVHSAQKAVSKQASASGDGGGFSGGGGGGGGGSSYGGR